MSGDEEMVPLSEVRITHPLLIVEDARLGNINLGVRTKPWSRVKVRGHNWPAHLPPHTPESLRLARQLAHASRVAP